MKSTDQLKKEWRSLKPGATVRVGKIISMIAIQSGLFSAPVASKEITHSGTYTFYTFTRK